MTKTKHPQAGFVAVNGTELYYETLGEGHPLVLLHGGYMDRRIWDDQFAVFADSHDKSGSYQVIRYDIRGFGKSDMPQVPYSNVQDLYELLNPTINRGSTRSRKPGTRKGHHYTRISLH